MSPRLPAVALAAVAVAVAVAAEPPTPTDEVKAVVSGNNAFAFDLYAQLRTKEGNLFFSPCSISGALAMTSAGARGKTLDEMAKALHFPAQEALHPGFAALNKQLNGAPGEKRGYQLSVANALWGMKGHAWRPEFLRLTRDHYGAGLEEVNFAQPEQAAKTINAWVEKQTHDRIKDLIKPDMLDGLTRLVLTNAIYFKGDWVSQFKADRTKEEAFTRADGKQVKAPLMRQKATFPYAETETFQALELPYVGKEVSMVVLLPKKADGISDLEKGLSADRVSATLARLAPHEIDVALPKFKATTEFVLNPELSALGMRAAFTPGAADFSGMDGGKELYISAVVHKAFVEVNEEGTEAAAATGVIVKTRSAPPPAPVFRADHPFVFLIRDTRSGAVLFLGRLSDPLAG